jgi:protein-disulfide isomerase
VSGILILCTIGFFILLTAMFNGGINGIKLNNLSKTTPDKVAAAPSPTAPSPTAPAAQAPTPTTPTGQVPPVTSRDHVRGSASASITLVEYSDYECPFCKTFHATMLQLMSNYNGKIKWIFRHFPLMSLHQNAEKEAEAGECIAELGGNSAFWKYTDAIFQRTKSNGTGFALSDLSALAAEVGVPKQAFESCLNSDKYANYVQTSESGGASAGVDGTPATIVMNANGKTQLVTGAVPYSQIKAAVDAMLAQ